MSVAGTPTPIDATTIARLKAQACAAQHGFATDESGALIVAFSFFPTGPIMVVFVDCNGKSLMTTSITHSGFPIRPHRSQTNRTPKVISGRLIFTAGKCQSGIL